MFRSLTCISSALLVWTFSGQVHAQNPVSALAVENDRSAHLERQIADLEGRLARLEKITAGQATSVQPVLRDEVLCFNAPWASPSEKMRPIERKLRDEGFRLHEIDVDREPKLATQYHVTAVPTYIYLKDGREVSRRSGVVSESLLRTWLGKYSPKPSNPTQP